MAITRAKKEEILAELIADFKSAKSVVFSHYIGTTVKDMTKLRDSLRKEKVKFAVAKKTLIQKAAQEAGVESIPQEILEGPIGVAFGTEDAVAPARLIHTFGKEHETVSITGAIFESKILNAKDAKVIATLPSREQLLGQLVGLFNAPIAGFHRVLHSLLRSFVYACSEVAKKQSNAKT